MRTSGTNSGFKRQSRSGLTSANAKKWEPQRGHAVDGIDQRVEGPSESMIGPQQTEGSKQRGKPNTVIARFPSCQQTDSFCRGRLGSEGVVALDR
jgi:hypothetical protein